jgi:hypothetical protein
MNDSAKHHDGEAGPRQNNHHAILPIFSLFGYVGGKVQNGNYQQPQWIPFLHGFPARDSKDEPTTYRGFSPSQQLHVRVA